MTISKLDHVNVKTTQLDEMISWYSSVLGMTSGKRPDFSFPGAWMYAGDHAMVHLVGISGEAGTGSEVPLKLEHFAFSANGCAEFEDRLKLQGVKYRKSELTEYQLIQINVWDPDGNHIHLDFPANE